MQVHVACSSLVIFIYWACESQTKHIPCSKVGLDLWKWLGLKDTSKMQTAFTIKLDINSLQSNMLKQHWAPFCHLLGNISTCWSPNYSKKGSCNRSAGGGMVRIKSWVSHFNCTIYGSSACRFTSTVQMVFSSTLTVIRWILFWYKPIGCTLHATCFFSFLWKLPQFCVQIYGLGFRFTV